MLVRTHRLITSTLVFLAINILAMNSGLADDSVPVKIAGAYYVDSRGFTTAAIGLSSDRLPAGFSLWGFSDFHGDHSSNNAELTRSFSEYRLSHAGVGRLFNVEGLAFQAELNAITGDGNDLVRFGLTYKHNILLPWGGDAGSQGWLQWRAFPHETDNNGGQASLIFFLPLSSRVSIKGFVDYNVIERSDNRWVVEPELKVQITPRLSTLIEYRYNQYEDANPAIRGSAVAVGLRYRFSR